MDTNDLLGTVIVGAIAIKLLDGDNNHKKNKKTKKNEWF